MSTSFLSKKFQDQLLRNLSEISFPPCRNLKANMREEGVDKTWRLLVKKVTRARVMSTVSSQEVPEVVKKSWAEYNRRRTARFR
jgi:hypothetical protein